MNDLPNNGRPVSDGLHPAIYGAMIGLAVWFVVSAWMFFGTDSYAGWLDVVVTALFVMAVLLPLVLWSVWWRHIHADHERARFRDWRRGEMDTWQCRLGASEASFQVLLPIAAVAFGITAIGIVFHLASHVAA
ncbi:MAG TPA: hypothetical protein VM867_09075 [Xanthobacteraceae bacterium]|nr:hypothetical protein [Xanthobacteraceae bacterium]